MSEEPENNNPPDNDTPELNLEEVTAVEPEELSDEQKTFLEENKDSLNDEQKEKYGFTEEEEKPEVIEPETRGKKEDEEPEGDEEPEEGVPDDEKVISKIVDKKLKGVSSITKELQEIKDRQEVDSFINAKPEFGKYRDTILKHVAHPAYKNIPVHFIAAAIASKDMQKLGAQKEREAAKKAKETQGNGGSYRKPGGVKVDWLTATKEDFEAQREKVLGRAGN